jgi:hypothetical protein
MAELAESQVGGRVRKDVCGSYTRSMRSKAFTFGRRATAPGLGLLAVHWTNDDANLTDF